MAEQEKDIEIEKSEEASGTDETAEETVNFRETQEQTESEEDTQSEAEEEENGAVPPEGEDPKTWAEKRAAKKQAKLDKKAQGYKCNQVYKIFLHKYFLLYLMIYLNCQFCSHSF